MNGVVSAAVTADSAGDDDLLTALLAPMRLQGVFASEWSLRAPWGIAGPGEPCALLHYVRSGQVVMSITGESAPAVLRAGELAIFPHGITHTLADQPGRSLTPLDDVLPERSTGSTRVINVDGPGPVTELLCGGLHYDTAAVSPIYLRLPHLIVLGQEMLEHEPLLTAVLDSLYSGSDAGCAAASLVSLRGFELVFLLALRVALTRVEVASSALAALRHPNISRALLAIQTRYAEPWTLETLAAEARMSRSAFAATFRRLTGTTPGQYLIDRRMQEAAHLLTETQLLPSVLPARVGYHSSVGFLTAFRKHYGTTPGRFRRTRPE